MWSQPCLCMAPATFVSRLWLPTTTHPPYNHGNTATCVRFHYTTDQRVPHLHTCREIRPHPNLIHPPHEGYNKTRGGGRLLGECWARSAMGFCDKRESLIINAINQLPRITDRYNRDRHLTWPCFYRTAAVSRRIALCCVDNVNLIWCFPKNWMSSRRQNPYVPCTNLGHFKIWLCRAKCWTHMVSPMIKSTKSTHWSRIIYIAPLCHIKL